MSVDNKIVLLLLRPKLENLITRKMWQVINNKQKIEMHGAYCYCNN